MINIVNSSLSKKYGIFAVQLALLMLFSLGIYWLAGSLAVKSYFLGGLAWLIPAIYFTLGVRKITPNLSHGKMLQYFLLQETIKWLISLLMVVTILLIFDIKSLNFISGYLTAIVISLLTALWEVKR